MGIKISVKIDAKLRDLNPMDVYAGPMQRFASATMADGMAYLNSSVPIDRGRLRNSLQPGGAETGVEGNPVSTIRWGTNLDYGMRLDKGSRSDPHRVPVEDLERWVKRRKLASGRAATSLAWAIAKTLEKRGTRNEPRYVAGPRAGRPTKGWFSGIAHALRDTAPAREAQLRADILSRWTELKGG